MAEVVWKDAAYAWRGLRKSPGFTLAVVASLALGIGANTAIFSLVDAVMWRTLPVKDPWTLMSVVHGRNGVFNEGFSYQQFRALRENAAGFSGIAGYARTRLNVSIEAGRAEPTAEAQLVSGAYFALLGVTPRVGRAIGPKDDRMTNAHPVAMISHAYWKRRFDSDPRIVGRVIRISDAPFTLIGVAPPDFFGVEVGVAPEIFVPLMMQPVAMPASENLLDNPIIYSTWINVLARLAPGASAESALASAVHAYRAEMPKGLKFLNPGQESLRVTSAATGLSSLRQQFSQSLWLLMAVTGVVLLIACANIANLLLARAAARQPEFLLRLSIGAGRGRLVGQLLVESVLLAALGGVAALAVAVWAARSLVSFLSQGRLTPISLSLTPDARVLGFTAAVALLTGVVFGLAPAIQAARVDLVQGMRSARARPGKMLAVSQVALSLVLLVVAGLFTRSLVTLVNRNESSVNQRVLVVRVEPKGSDQRNIPGTPQRLDRIYRDLASRVESIAGVQSASLAQFTPSSVRGLSGRVELEPGDQVQVYTPMVYPRYFATAGIELLAGRDLSEADLAANAPLVAVVNEAFASHVFPGMTNPVGRQYRIQGELREVIGVVKDSRLSDMRSDQAPAIAYQPFLQTRTGRGQMALYVRTGNADPAAIARQVRAEVQAIDPAMPMFEVRTVSAELEAVLVRERLLAILSGLSGLLALALACIGLYGLFAFTVVRRTREMAIRKAAGAAEGDVVWTVMREVLLLVAAGVGTGVPLAIACGRLASSRVAGLLFGLEASDPWTIAGAALVLAFAAAAAGYLPARFASRVDPMVALRVD